MHYVIPYYYIKCDEAQWLAYFYPGARSRLNRYILNPEIMVRLVPHNLYYRGPITVFTFFIKPMAMIAGEDSTLHVNIILCVLKYLRK